MVSSLSDTVHIYLDGNSSETQEIREAKTKLIQIGSSITPALIEGLRKRLREYQTYTQSSSETRALIQKTLDMARQQNESIPVYMEQSLINQLNDLPPDNTPGISKLQRMLSISSIYKASQLIQEIGDGCDQGLCSNLYSNDISLVLTAALVIYDLDDPSPFVLRSIIASRHLHIELEFLPLQLRVLFYILFGTLAKNGNKQAEEIIAEDAKAYSRNGDSEAFMASARDMTIHFVSMS